MKKLLAISLLSTGLFFGNNAVKADWDHWGIKPVSEEYNGATHTFWKLYTINSFSGEATFRKNWCRYSSCQSATGIPRLRDVVDIAYPENHVNKDSFIIREYDSNGDVVYKKYTLTNNSISGEIVSDSNDYWFDDYSYTAIRGADQLDSDGNYYSDIGGQMWLKQTSAGTVSFGKSGETTPLYEISESGVSLGGTNLISRSSDGVLSIGANSVKLEEVSDIQRIWATNSSGTKIPINIYGSDLQIDGVGVQTQIDANASNISTNTSNISTNTSNISTNTSNISANASAIETLQSSNSSSGTTITSNTNNINKLGEGVAGSTALTAALTALPQTSKESKLSCGIGTGAYSSRYAVGFGCASKLSDRFDINAGGSYVLGGSKSYGGGTLDSGVIKAGFVFKLGELNKSDQISLKNENIMSSKITKIEKKNKELQARNEEIFLQNQQLLARLEKLENVAFNAKKTQDIKLSKRIAE